MRFEKKKTNLDSIEAYACICMAAVCRCTCTCGCGCASSESLQQSATESGFEVGKNESSIIPYFNSNSALAIQVSM